jgi:ketol-acid reductoisomerase
VSQSPPRVEDARVAIDALAIGPEVREAMKQVLADIQSGEFAKEWIAENRAGQENFKRMREEQKDHQIEREGKELRSMMDWIDTEF